MGHTSGALAPRNSAGCVRRRQDAIFLFTFDREWSDPTPVGCLEQQVKSSQVKSSQVKIQNGGRLSAAFGAHRWRERSGGQISAQPALLDSPESGHHPHLLVLDHRGAPGASTSCLFRKSTVRQCNTAPGRRCGSDRGHARGLLRWAEVPVGSGDLRRRASCARGPSPTSFGVLGLTRARQSILARQQGRLARRRQERSRSFLRCAPHTPPFISHACARVPLLTSAATEPLPTRRATLGRPSKPSGTLRSRNVKAARYGS
jgi:hypothetical protein